MPSKYMRIEVIENYFAWQAAGPWQLDLGSWTLAAGPWQLDLGSLSS
jgi:hypothetical protein